MTPPRASLPSLLAFACLAAAACGSGAAPPPTAKESRPMTPADASAGARLVEVNLGPHRFRIPSNYFDIERGQDAQGFMRLILRWPELAPLAPGVHYLSGGETERARNLDISPTYIDRVPLQTRLDRDWISNVDSEQELRENPTLNPELRLKGADVDGLTPYYTDFAKVDAYYAKLYGKKDIPATDRHSLFNNDWFVARDADGTLTTIIKCTAREEPDGARIADGRLELLDAPRLPSCSHAFVMPKYGTYVQVSYLRIFMRDWRRIEQRIRAVFDDGHIGDDATRR
ncbi:hypothetical protein [Lysobacter enzymogenes]|uniref:hypothetical protein n=1 Tax=Lysobacter enzymogenes TaxID=69 RepID=UPI00099BACA2|nr:hypothetical protein [Lysobacter enzymogenes]UZW60930.1 hypothetical protein BV903_001170 [Lysobacter enzymogenes]